MKSTASLFRHGFRAALLGLAPALLLACAAPDNTPPDADPDAVMCTMDVIQCSNGDWVGRQPPTCQFACPAGSHPLVPPR